MTTRRSPDSATRRRIPTRRQAASGAQQRVRKAFPLADGVTYAIAAGALAAVLTITQLLEAVGAHLAGLP